ncbi:hypothetical protein [Ekhidna sp.]|uniref:hypothetical protein n=1 Tax=Ekhidna sp. TaxID=2608089 RepID=UPI003C7A0B0F
MKSLRNKLLYTGLYFSLVAVGFLIAKFFDIPHFEIKKEVDLISILSILVTVWLAVIITTVFDKRKSDFRIEKDIVIRRVDSIYNLVGELQRKSVSGEIEYTNAASSLKRINTSLSSLYKLIEKCQFSIADDIRSSLRESVSILKDELTDTPKLTTEQIQNSDIPMEVKDGMIHFNKHKVAQLESSFDKLSDLLLELQIRINKK